MNCSNMIFGIVPFNYRIVRGTTNFIFCKEFSWGIKTCILFATTNQANSKNRCDKIFLEVSHEFPNSDIGLIRHILCLARVY